MRKYPITLGITIPSTNPQRASISRWCSTSLIKTWKNITDSPFWLSEFLGEGGVTTFPIYPHTNDSSKITLSETWIINFRSKATSISEEGVDIDAEIVLIFKEGKQIHLRDDNNQAELLDSLLKDGWEYLK